MIGRLAVHFDSLAKITTISNFPSVNPSTSDGQDSHSSIIARASSSSGEPSPVKISTARWA